MTAIEWTDATWNPVTGCTKVSPGCLNCYAATMANRLRAMPAGRAYHDRGGVRIAEVRAGRAVYTGDVRTVAGKLDEPLRWRAPRRVFVCSMADLFHENVSYETIDRVFAVMAVCPDHTFQVLTKRPERMAEYTRERDAARGVIWDAARNIMPTAELHLRALRPWPYDNVWLGTSVEDQAAADQRVPALLGCVAALRFLSCEPLLGPVDLTMADDGWCQPDGIGWVIIGGESGPRARACDMAWIEGLAGQCELSGVACFVKQIGSAPTVDGQAVALDDRHGRDMCEWPAGLRVRAWPEAMDRQPKETV